MISLSFSPLPVSSGSEASSSTGAGSAGFGSALEKASAGMPAGISFIPVVINTGIQKTDSGVASQGPLVAGQQPLSQPDTPSVLQPPPGAGALVTPFSGNSTPAIPPPAERFGGATGGGLEARMENLREIFGAALARDQANRPVQQTISDAAQAAADRRAANEAALAPVVAPPADPAMPGVVDMVGSPAPVEGTTTPLPIAKAPIKSNAEIFEAELSKSQSDRPVQESMQKELEKTRADRPISETVKDDLQKSKEDRPLEERMLESLVAGKDELTLSEGAQEKLLEAVAEEGGTIDPARRKIVLADAEAKLKEKYQLIIDNFILRAGKAVPPGLADKIA